MSTGKRLMVGTVSAIAVAALAGCSASGVSSEGSSSIGTPDGHGKSISVWIMQDDLSSKVIDAANAQFKKETGATAKVQIQQWDNITTKLATALAQTGAPDVVDIGNTDVPVFAATGGLADLSGYKKDLADGQTWLPGLVGPATVDGKLYAAPLFAGNRSVIYNKKTWEAAGVTSAPTSYSELTADLDKIKSANTAPNFSAFYLPGKDWYAGMQWVWDEGGTLATTSDRKWTGVIDSDKADAGLTAWKKFQNTYSVSSSADVDTATPAQTDVLANGQASAILGTAGDLAKTITANPDLKDQLGTFPLPSATAGKGQPVFLGGSDLGVPAKSSNQKLAAYYLKILTSEKFQKEQIFGVDGWEPNSKEGLAAVLPDVDAQHKAFFTAAENSQPTPASPGWATIEGDSSIGAMFADIATGRSSVHAASSSFASHLTSALNASN